MTEPLVTVGITCFNAEDTIERAVNCALNQSWSNVEIIVVDDASTDGSASMLEALAARHSRVRLVRHPVNLGYAGALNAIIENARGDFIAIFDDDDDSASDRLRAQLDRIFAYEKETGAELILCYSNRNVVPAGATHPDHVAKALGRHAEEPKGIAVAEKIFGYRIHPQYVWGLFGSCTLMARRETFRKIGLFDEQFRRCAEWDYAIRAAMAGAHFIAVDRPLVTQFKTRSEDKKGVIPLKYDLMIREKYKAHLKQRNFYRASRMIARARFAGSRQQIVRSHLYISLAYLLSPSLLPQSRIFGVLCEALKPPSHKRRTLDH